MIVHLRTLDDLEIHLRKERSTGVVRLTHGDNRRFSEALAEAQRVSDTFPALPVLLVKALDEDDCEERSAKLIADHGVPDRLLVLPVWWLVWRGRIVMVYKASEKIMREVLGIFSRKKDESALDPVIGWIEKNMHAERGTGKFKNPDTLPKTAGGRRAGARPSEVPTPPRGTPRRPSEERTPPSGTLTDPWAVLGVPRGATLELVRKAYRELSARYHPDKVAHLGEKEQQHAHRRMSEINAAWEAIKSKAR